MLLNTTSIFTKRRPGEAVISSINLAEMYGPLQSLGRFSNFVMSQHCNAAKYAMHQEPHTDIPTARTTTFYTLSPT